MGHLQSAFPTVLLQLVNKQNLFSMLSHFQCCHASEIPGELRVNHEHTRRKQKKKIKQPSITRNVMNGWQELYAYPPTRKQEQEISAPSQSCKNQEKPMGARFNTRNTSITTEITFPWFKTDEPSQSLH